MTAAEAKEITQKNLETFERKEKEKEIKKDLEAKEMAEKNRKKILKNTLELIQEEIAKNHFSTFIFCSPNCRSYSDKFLIEDLRYLGYDVSYETHSFSDDDQGSPIINISWK